MAADAAGLIYNADQFGKGFFGEVQSQRCCYLWRAIRLRWNAAPGRPLEADAGQGAAGLGNVRRAAVQPQVVGQPIRDLAMPELTDSKRQDIATAMGVPHSLVASGAANYWATAQADRLNLYDFTILPEATLVAE